MLCLKRLYAEQINKLLQDYYFNLENNPQGRESHFGVLASGISHLYGAAFCTNDDDSLRDLRPFISAIMDGEVPAPAHTRTAEQATVTFQTGGN